MDPTSSITVTASPPADGTPPTITHYEQRARDLMKAFDDIAAILPAVDPGELASDKFIRGHLTVSDEFCATTIVAVEQLAELQGVGSLDVVFGRDTLQLLAAFRPVLDKIDAFRGQMNYVLIVAKAILASQTLQTYDIAKGIARTNKSVAAYVAMMKRDLNRAHVTKEERELRKAERKLRRTLKAEKAAAVLKEVQAAT